MTLCITRKSPQKNFIIPGKFFPGGAGDRLPVLLM
jgi:hypothetical protein